MLLMAAIVLSAMGLGGVIGYHFGFEHGEASEIENWERLLDRIRELHAEVEMLNKCEQSTG